MKIIDQILYDSILNNIKRLLYINVSNYLMRVARLQKERA